jgi:hypothetical protein
MEGGSGSPLRCIVSSPSSQPRKLTFLRSRAALLPSPSFFLSHTHNSHDYPLTHSHRSPPFAYRTAAPNSKMSFSFSLLLVAFPRLFLSFYRCSTISSSHASSLSVSLEEQGEKKGTKRKVSLIVVLLVHYVPAVPDEPPRRLPIWHDIFEQLLNRPQRSLRIRHPPSLSPQLLLRRSEDEFIRLQPRRVRRGVEDLETYKKERGKCQYSRRRKKRRKGGNAP